uniref:Large ribosomal subunit protein uL2 C-terminal domain-containing protein n=1 Tax=Zonotrichia albicollis TaxID=44394 RepID=A0A8D2MI72_ZONAL
MQCLLPSSNVPQGFLDSQSNPLATTQQAVKARSGLTHIPLCPKTRALLGTQTSPHVALKSVSKPRKTSPNQFPQPSESGITQYKVTVLVICLDPCLSRDHGQDCLFQQLTQAISGRWIIATENMQPGSTITNSPHISRMAVSAGEGDAYPLGALPVGTLICNLESHPGKGAQYIRAAGMFPHREPALCRGLAEHRWRGGQGDTALAGQ